MFELFEAYVCWTEWKILQIQVEIITDFLLFYFQRSGRHRQSDREWLNEIERKVGGGGAKEKQSQITIKQNIQNYIGNGALAYLYVYYLREVFLFHCHYSPPHSFYYFLFVLSSWIFCLFVHNVLACYVYTILRNSIVKTTTDCRISWF